MRPAAPKSPCTVKRNQVDGIESGPGAGRRRQASGWPDQVDRARLYIGKSTNLRSRIGRLLGGALTGAEGHIAGWRIGNGDKNTGDAPVRVEVIEIHWWPDLDLHGARRAPAPSAQEAALIKRHNPQLNTQHRSHVAHTPTDLSDEQLKIAINTAAGWPAEADPCHVTPWNLAGWSGWSAPCTFADTVTVYIGRASAGGGVGLWAYEDGSQIFPEGKAGATVRKPERLAAKLTEWKLLRDRRYPAAGPDPAR
ncbi:MAG: GIY-YIG nuclease family protein [Deltaproteobacteria bacterium]|nr:GIY-YIG nuclease family protein [Deltaproteobacteria bacterium]